MYVVPHSIAQTHMHSKSEVDFTSLFVQSAHKPFLLFYQIFKHQDHHTQDHQHDTNGSV